MIIIGSTAIKFWYPDFKREPKDLDLILYEGEEIPKEFLEKYNKIETLSNPILLQFCKNNLFQISPYLNPDILYTLKMSHMFWDINWEKHMFDILDLNGLVKDAHNYSVHHILADFLPL